MPRDPREPTWVYRITCEHGGLLYVGIAVDLDRRLAQHRATKAWWPDASEVIARQFPTRLMARKAELAAITYDRPMHNIEGVIPNCQYDADRWAQLCAGLPTVHRDLRHQEVI